MLNEICRDNLIAAAKVYAKATGSTLDQISARFYGNRIFLRDFQRGKKTISVKQFDKMWEQLLANWPEGTDFPFMRSVVFPRPGQSPE